MNAKLALLGMLICVLAIPAAAEEQTRTGVYDAVLDENGLDTPNISTTELRRVLAEKSAIVFDVRTYEEYAISHIPGVINVAGKPESTREEFTSDANEIGRIVGADKVAKIVLYCGGPFCGKSKRVAADLLKAGYRNVRRYQLGIPVWRALGGLTEIEPEGIRYVLSRDQTAVFIDVRDSEAFQAGTLANARNIPASLVGPGSGGQEVKDAKQDGRLPMEDHNTRIVVFGKEASAARVVAQALARNAFHNVSYFAGTYAEMNALLRH